MAVPNDVTVSRQVLAEPDAGLTEHTWATLADGTPLVTAARRGKGVIVLFHVTADTRWSDLPLSGAFVDMLKRIVALAGTTARRRSRTAERRRRPRAKRCAPSRVLDGFGAFAPPPSTARPVPADFAGRATADHPPGFYGPPEGLLAVNTLAASDRLAPARFRPARQRHPRNLSHAASRRICAGRSSSPRSRLLVLDSADRAVRSAAALRGSCRALRARRPRSVLAIAALALAHMLRGRPTTRRASEVPRSALETKLAYVITGDARGRLRSASPALPA